MCKISYIIASRNDSYGGDSVGRLETTLNHTGFILWEKGKLEESEVVLTDWSTPSSRRPLKDVLQLNDKIKSILKIIEVPSRIAQKYQKDSPFSEVHAMNAAFRRSSGRFFGRIDQDTLIGTRFIDWFYNQFHEIDLGFDWPKVAFSGRRNLDEEQSKMPYQFILDDSKYKEVQICHSNNFYSRVNPESAGSMMLFYAGAIGILLIERGLYIDHLGYNEDLIYMNNMDTEFLNRLRSKNDFYNLGLKCDGDFYHLHHTRKDGAKDDAQIYAEEQGVRETNPPILRSEYNYNPNSDNWGLNNEDLNVFSFN